MQGLFGKKGKMADDTKGNSDRTTAVPEKKGWIKSIFLRNKKSEISHSANKIDYPAAGIAQEPNFLMDIDLGQHSSKIEPELALWLNDGRIVKSLEELTKAIRTMKGRIFSQHQENNEIRDWVRDITGNAQIAAEIGAAKTKNDVIKALERHLKESRKKKKAEPAEKREIQKAIEEIREKPSSTEKSSPLEERERRLEEKERHLEIEEDVLNKKRMALANRRYHMLKERGELEKEKFERIIKHHYNKMKETGTEASKEGLPEMELSQEYTKEKIRLLTIDARASLNSGDKKNAKKTITELKNAIKFSTIEPSEIKNLEYDILELEADLKLSMLA